MTIKKLSKMPYAQAHVEIDDNGNITLFSYVTRVATLTADGWLTIHGLYSMTTRKHISAFMHEYCQPFDYQTTKKICEEKLRLNIDTAEIEELE